MRSLSHPDARTRAFPPISYQLKSNIYCGNALPLQIYVGENINLVGAKHYGRYLLLKILTLIPECFAQIFIGENFNLNTGMLRPDI